MISKLLSLIRRPKPTMAPRRDFAMAQINRLTNDWNLTQSDADRELRSALKVMRERARDLDRNNDYIKGYFDDLEANVLGPDGIRLEMKIQEIVKGIPRYDDRANRIIEDSWAEWCRPANCSSNGRFSWLDMQRLALRGTARDGASLTRKHYTGAFGFCLEGMEIDYLDTDYNMPLPNGQIALGIQYDASGAVVAYHLFGVHPGSINNTTAVYQTRTPYPAKQFIHLFRPTRFGQGTGEPWVHTSGFRAKNLNGYEEAEVVAARVSACKMAFLERNTAVEFTGATAADGQRQMETSPGLIEELPPGMTVKPFDPNHPNSNLPAFIKAELRGIAKGLGRSYITFANDLEAVNYSSARVGLLDERENWKAIQRWFIDSYVTPIFEEWLETALGLGKITDGILTLPASKFKKFNAPEWKPRRWGYIDPLKDIQASVLSVEKGFSSRRSEVAANGGDIEQVMLEQQADKELETQHGLDFTPESKQAANATSDRPKGSKDVDKEEE